MNCFLCGSTENLTDDHIPPKCIFAPPRPTNLITVRACFTCNNSFKLDDEYFRVAIAAQGYWSKSGRRIWEEKVVGSTFVRSPALRKVLTDSIIPIPLDRRSEHFPEAEEGIHFDRGRINRVLNKVLRGLYRHHYPTIDLGAEITTEFEMIAPSAEACELLNVLKREDIGGDSFRYWRGLSKDDLRVSIWAFSFYDRTYFRAITAVAT